MDAFEDSSSSSRDSSTDDSDDDEDDDDDDDDDDDNDTDNDAQLRSNSISIDSEEKAAQDSSLAAATLTSTSASLSSSGMADYTRKHRARLRSPWSCSAITLATSAMALLLLLVIVQSFLSRQLDPKGCAMSYMRAAFAKFTDFDTEHTRFATKYSLYLYREGGIDEDTRVGSPQETGHVGNMDTSTHTWRRSKESPYSSSREMQVATSRFAPSPQRPPTTFMMSCSTTKTPCIRANVRSTSSRWTLTRTLPPSTARHCWTRPNI